MTGPGESGAPIAGRGRGARSIGLAVLLAAALAVGAADSGGRARGVEIEPWTEGIGPEQAWAPLTLLTVADVGHHGAVGDGRADDTAALQRAIDSVPDGGGIVWLPPGRTYRTTDIIRIAGDHVKLWAPNGEAEIRPSATIGERRHALIVDGATGVGLFGLTFRSDGDRRRTALEDSAVVLDGAVETELVGLEITGSPSAAIFVFGASRQTWVVGNDLHDNWADAVHFTDGSRQAWVWDNRISNGGSTPGDDGIACVTYGSSPRCGAMEWWGNVHLGGGWGRGLAVIGGDHVHVHDNLVVDTAAAGILVASEPSYDTPGSEAIRIEANVVCRAGHTVPHPGILISALDGSITDVVVSDNQVADSAGGSFRAEGDVDDLVERGTSAVDPGGCRPGPTTNAGRAARATSILATRDATFVDPGARRGLSRLHVRSGPGGGFEQRLEYVVAGAPSALDVWLADRPAAATRFARPPAEAGEEEYVVVLSGSPLRIPRSLRAVDFDELRALSGVVPELWEWLDAVDGR